MRCDNEIFEIGIKSAVEFMIECYNNTNGAWNMDGYVLEQDFFSRCYI